MIPGNVLSDPTPIQENFNSPDNIVPFRDLDWELGGVGLNDPSEGLEVQVWQLYLNSDTGQIYVSAPNTPSTLLFTAPGTTDISLAFDQNMNPMVAFFQSGRARYWWYDTVAGAMVFTYLPTGTGVPKVTMDDKRLLQVSVSDVIMAYTRAGTLYFRMQRDRYLIEYTLATGVLGEVIQIGMGDKLRLKITTGLMDDNIAPTIANSRVSVGGNLRVTTLGPRIVKV